ncbi:MerR family transcriptional regulator [Jiangella rhizosphaerae]|uniref:MerR family transcriptional regulator n=1 Tax=Jiangella rhizosphaerae TaxID=2293569 RepID=A0A418KXY5_9ACTN|nr:MerR family transcriptional regulator [Jiangella rhizosphaerae]
MTPKPVATGVAAKAVGVDPTTLMRWWHKGLVTPEYVTPGGHARWDLEKLKEQLRALRQRGE